MKKYFIIIIFIFLACLWFWSKNGIQIKTIIIKKDSFVKIYFDNYLLGSARDTSLENKKLTVNFSKQDLDSKYFNNQPETDKNNVLLPKYNYELKLLLNNPFTVRLNFEGKQPYVFYFNPYRHLNSGWEDKHEVLRETKNNQVQIGFFNGIKWTLWIILKPFPILIPVFAIIYLFGKKIKDDSKKINLKLSIKIIIIPLIIALLSFFWSRHLMVNYLRDVPHVPDSISYVVLAKIISSGKFIFPYSEIPSYIRADQIKDFFYHWFQTNKTGLFVPYLIGHPLVLALGNLFGIINYIPPLVGSLTLLLIFFITYFLTQSVMFSLISMGLCFISPFFQTQTIDYLSHNSAVLFILFSIFPLFLNKESTKYFLLTGFFLGMLLNTRPLTFVAVFISIILYLIIEFIKDKKFKKFCHLSFKFV